MFRVMFRVSLESQSSSCRDLLRLAKTDVTVIWVSPCFGYPRTHIPSVLGIPSKNTQNTESVNLGQVKSSTIQLKTHLSSYEALSHFFLTL